MSENPSKSEDKKSYSCGLTDLLAKIKNHLVSIAFDRTFRFSALNTLIQGAALAASSVLVLQKLSPESQGFYYTFLSLVALQIFLDLGFGQCLLQYLSSEFVKVESVDVTKTQGRSAARARFHYYAGLVKNWYLGAVLLMIAVVGPLGQLFIEIQIQSKYMDVDWRGPWWLLTMSTAIGLIPQGLMLILDGCNYVEWTNRARMLASLTRAGSLVAALSLEAELYALGLAALSYSLMAGVQCAFKWRNFFLDLFNTNEKATPTGISWRRDILPFQWRLAASWAAGYFCLSAYSPILFAKCGAQQAGQFGLTNALTQGISTIASSWAAIKVPSFGALVSTGQEQELYRVCRKTTVESVLIAAALGIALISTRWLADPLLHEYRERLLSPVALSILVAVVVVNQVVFVQAYYTRAHRMEPFLGVSVTAGILHFLSAFFLSEYAGAQGVVYGMAGVTLITVFYSTKVFIAKKKEWHS